MGEMMTYPPGTFCWVDLATNAPESAKAFYSAIFGWTARDVPTDYEIPYTHLFSGGKLACALYEMAPEQGAFPYWAAYVAVNDAQASAERAEQLGGRVVMPVVDVMETGRLCFVQDPTKAVIGLWEPRKHPGAEIDNTVGARGWCELQTRDTAAAAAFYQGLFGWTARPSGQLADANYFIFELAGQEVGGMLELDKRWGPMPPNWSTYFGVVDCDWVVAETKRLGGSLVMEPMEVDGVGRFAFLGDPQGAIFAVIQSGAAPSAVISRSI
ncbi:glyoxalase [Thiocystis minor]|uniref:VOC family protein n=1 Tax=Thiocystis minor TaxID=61597 RepID=UPI001912D31C|nr:VOC family protein [Thiocystis minor]MBK5966166.1 glyoxalase [Thiocystis minor]